MKALKTAPKTKSLKRTNSSRKPKRPAKLTVINTWREAKKLKLHRYDIFGQKCLLEPGVNFFVLMLEALGATTEFSCEGHPDGFYIVFRGPVELAQKLVYCGFFRIELEGRHGATGKTYRWSIRLPDIGPRTEKMKEQTLTWAAESWNRLFGDLVKVHGKRRIKKKQKNASRCNA